MLRVYIAGPLSTGDYSQIVRNVYTAIEHANSVLVLGGAPILPHLSHFWNLFFYHSWDEWMALDKQYLPMCDCVYRLPGESKGADIEVGWAKSLNIPVYYTMPEVEYAIRHHVAVIPVKAQDA
jgi:hypothetical protein